MAEESTNGAIRLARAFLDLCEVLKHPKPGTVDPKGLTFTTEIREVTHERTVNRGNHPEAVAAWPELPGAIRAGILAMVKAASGAPR
jgi:hypothetical protein